MNNLILGGLWSCMGIVTSAVKISGMGFQEFLAGLPFLSFGEKEVGKGNDLSDTWVKLFMSVNSEFYLFIFVCVS